MVNEVLAEAGTNMSIGCPGVTRNTFVVQLEWRCLGQCGKKRASPSYGNDAAAGASLIKYNKDSQASSGSKAGGRKARVRLDQDMFSLEFDPVSARDQGKYLCLINNRPLPDAVIHLNILGKSLGFFCSSLS